MRKLFPLTLFALCMCLTPRSAIAQTAGIDNVIEITVTNDGTERYMGPVYITMPNADLRDLKLIDAFLGRQFFTDASNNLIAGAPTQNDADYGEWFFYADVQPGQVATYKSFMCFDCDEADINTGFPLGTVEHTDTQSVPYEGVVAPDNANLDFTTEDFEMRALDLNPRSCGGLVDKTERTTSDGYGFFFIGNEYYGDATTTPAGNQSAVYFHIDPLIDFFLCGIALPGHGASPTVSRLRIEQEGGNVIADTDELRWWQEGDELVVFKESRLLRASQTYNVYIECSSGNCLQNDGSSFSSTAAGLFTMSHDGGSESFDSISFSPAQIDADDGGLLLVDPDNVSGDIYTLIAGETMTPPHAWTPDGSGTEDWVAEVTSSTVDLVEGISGPVAQSYTRSSSLTANTEDLYLFHGFNGSAWLGAVSGPFSAQWQGSSAGAVVDSISQIGDAGNGYLWEWDWPQGATTFTYRARINDSDLTIDIGPIVLAAPPLTTGPSQVTQEVVGPVPLGFLTPHPTVASPYIQPYRDIADSSGLTAITWWLIFGTFVGALVSSWLMRRGLPEYGTVAVGGLIYIGMALVSGTGLLVLAILWLLYAVGAVTIRHAWRSGQ